MSIASLSERKCCGCTACVSICPCHAITMVMDREGFFSPSVDSLKCTNCGLCEKVCLANQPVSSHTDFKRSAFAAKYKDPDIRSQSQSGGAFYAIAERILTLGGVVYGAALGSDFTTRHIRVDDISVLSKLQKTKYVQSYMGTVFCDVFSDLKRGETVLFSGTPCQIEGLTAYLRAKHCPMDTLLTCDIVCYGVPSPGVFKEWIKCLEGAKKSKVESLQYRDTSLPWGKSMESYTFANGERLRGHFFTKLYFNNLIIRRSCHECRFCNTKHPADITLGDFWGIDDAIPGFSDDSGVSLVILNTHSGEKFLNQISEKFMLQSCSLEQAIAKQPRLQGIPTKESIHRKRFWNTHQKRGFKYIAQDEGFIEPTLSFKIESKLKSLVGKR